MVTNCHRTCYIKSKIRFIRGMVIIVAVVSIQNWLFYATLLETAEAGEDAV